MAAVKCPSVIDAPTKMVSSTHCFGCGSSGSVDCARKSVRMAPMTEWRATSMENASGAMRTKMNSIGSALSASSTTHALLKYSSRICDGSSISSGPRFTRTHGRNTVHSKITALNAASGTMYSAGGSSFAPYVMGEMKTLMLNRAYRNVMTMYAASVAVTIFVSGLSDFVRSVRCSRVSSDGFDGFSPGANPSDRQPFVAFMLLLLPRGRRRRLPSSRTSKEAVMGPFALSLSSRKLPRRLLVESPGPGAVGDAKDRCMLLKPKPPVAPPLLPGALSDDEGC
mmetsp:Transcript_26282/g.81188  ORF Transcript_26282/g.81188 Transcript_26282/m.81188 type:complete len:282 (+) Transcript_26282:1368-2213(+)